MFKELLNEVKSLRGIKIYKITTVNGQPFEDIMNICEVYNVCERIQVDDLNEYIPVIYVGIPDKRQIRNQFKNEIKQVKGLISIK